MDIDGQQVHFKPAARMDEVPDESVTLVVTSPPYWNVRDYGSDGAEIGFGQSYAAYITSLNEVWTECLRVLQPNGKMAINLQPLPVASEASGFGFRVIRNIMHDIEAFFYSHDCFLSGMHYWDKAAHVNNVSWGSYPKPTNIASNTSFEQVFTFVKRGKTRAASAAGMERSLLGKHEWRHWAVRCMWDDIAPVIKINARGENTFGHGAPFPEDIPYRIIRMHTIEGETVLDPFLGSGTTLKVCRLTGRKGIGYEINEGFKPLIEARLKESWTPPPVEPHYKSIGNETMATILQVAGDVAAGMAGQQTGGFEKTLLARLKRELPGVFSDAYVRNIKDRFTRPAP